MFQAYDTGAYELNDMLLAPVSATVQEISSQIAKCGIEVPVSMNESFKIASARDQAISVAVGRTGTSDISTLTMSDLTGIAKSNDVSLQYLVAALASADIAGVDIADFSRTDMQQIITETSRVLDVANTLNISEIQSVTFAEVLNMTRMAKDTALPSSFTTTNGSIISEVTPISADSMQLKIDSDVYNIQVTANNTVIVRNSAGNVVTSGANGVILGGFPITVNSTTRDVQIDGTTIGSAAWTSAQIIKDQVNQNINQYADLLEGYVDGTINSLTSLSEIQQKALQLRAFDLMVTHFEQATLTGGLTLTRAEVIANFNDTSADHHDEVVDIYNNMLTGQALAEQQSNDTNYKQSLQQALQYATGICI